MGPELSLLIVFIAMFALVLIGVPIAFALLVGSFAGLWSVVGLPLALEKFLSAPYNITANYSFAVFPLFLAMGHLAGEIGIAEQAYMAAYRWLGGIRGGLVMATIVAGALFAAMSGSTIASAVLFAKISLPELLRTGHLRSMSAACIASVGTLATMIPPSIMMVLFGLLTDTSVGKLLIAGIVPGILISGTFVAGIALMGRLNPQTIPKADIRFSWRERIVGVRGIWPILVTFLIVMGGIYTGKFTPTEAGGIGAFCVFLLALIRRAGAKKIMTGFAGAAGTAAQVFIIVVAGMIFGTVVGFSGILKPFMSFVEGLPIPSLGIMAIIVVIYLLLGMFLDPVTMLVISLPFTFPLVTETLGYSPFAFGVMAIMLVEMAVITPPIGFNVFVVAGAANMPSTTVFRGIVPFFIMMMIALWMIILFPQIATFLPDLMG